MWLNDKNAGTVWPSKSLESGIKKGDQPPTKPRSPELGSLASHPEMRKECTEVNPEVTTVNAQSVDTDPEGLNVSGQVITAGDMGILRMSDKWPNECLINAEQHLLCKKYPQIGSLHAMELSDTCTLAYRRRQNSFVQIITCSHIRYAFQTWIAILTQ